MQVPHTYSVWQPLPSRVYLWWNRHPKIAEVHVYTHVLDICLLLRSQLPPNCLDAGDMSDASPCRYPTHILSDNHCHRVCTCEAIGARKLLKFTFIHTVPTFACFFALNFRQSPSRIEIFRILLHARTPHTFWLTTTSIKCVFVKKKAPENRSQVDVYTDGLDISLKVLEW